MSLSPLAKGDVPARTRGYALLDDPRVLGWGSIVLVLVVWELVARLFNVSALYLPRPSQIVVALVARTRATRGQDRNSPLQLPSAAAVDPSFPLCHSGNCSYGRLN